MLQRGICRAVHRVTDLEKILVRISKDEADEQQAHSMIPKTERYTDTLKQALTSFSISEDLVEMIVALTLKIVK